MKKILCLFNFLCWALISYSQSPQTTLWKKTFDSVTHINPLPAFLVAAIDKDGIFFEYDHGKEVWTKDEPLQANSIFRIYSMTKAISTVAALQLVEQGKIKLDEPLDKLMPEMTSIPILQPDGKLVKAKKTITLRQLLTHTSGFGYDFDSYRLFHFTKPVNWPYKDLPRLFEAGETFFYGSGMDWVGRIIEKVSGEDLEKYLKAHVTGPLGMTRTFFTVPDSLIGHVVSFGNLVNGEFVLDTSRIIKKGGIKPPEYNAGGGLFSTLQDYAVFLRCILNDGTLLGQQILSKKTLDEMFVNQIGDKFVHLETINASSPPNDTSLTYKGTAKWGLGWAIRGNQSNTFSTSNSVYWGGIANTNFRVNRASGRAVLFFSNTAPFSNVHTTSATKLAETMFLNDK